MNKSIFSTLMVLALAFGAAHLSAAESDAAATDSSPTGTKAPTNSIHTDLVKLVSHVNVKFNQDKDKETDYAGELKEFDELIAKNKDAAPDDLAPILKMKALLYLQVLHDSDKALVVFKQLKTDYPTSKDGQNVDQMIAQIQQVAERKKATESLVAGAPFPDFTETDLEGKPLSISNYKGKVVLVDFWATWCGPCVAKLPDIQAAYNKYHDQGFEIVGVSLDVEKGRLEQFIKQKKMPWPEFFDGKQWENKLAVKYGIEAIPCGYLLDRDGKIIAKVSGADDLDGEIAKALKK